MKQSIGHKKLNPLQGLLLILGLAAVLILLNYVAINLVAAWFSRLSPRAGTIAGLVTFFGSAAALFCAGFPNSLLKISSAAFISPSFAFSFKASAMSCMSSAVTAFSSAFFSASMRRPLPPGLPEVKRPLLSCPS